MTVRGRVIDGVVVLEPGVRLPEGLEVQVAALDPPNAAPDPAALTALFRAGERAQPTGITDLAVNHDHYLYGHPKATGE